MNPRRPTPSGPEPDIGAEPLLPRDPQSNGKDQGFLKQVSDKRLSQFESWCRQHASSEVCKQYRRKVWEILSGLRNPEDTRWHLTAWKRYLRWECEEKGKKSSCEDFKKYKTRPSRPDLYVPQDSEIKVALDSSLGFFYRILVESGLRAVEAARVLEGDLRCVELGGFVRCELKMIRRSKRAFWAYLLERPEPRPVDLGRLQEARQELGLIPFKYVRKWVATKMISLGLQEATVNFIQGRVPDSVLRKHYLNLLTIADKEYEKYAVWLRQFLAHL